jgi:prevent-host-death family protein
MRNVNLREAKAEFSSVVDQVLKGEFVTITRHGKPVATLVPVQAAEIALKALGKERTGRVSYLKTFPGGEFERNRAPSRDVVL